MLVSVFRGRLQGCFLHGIDLLFEQLSFYFIRTDFGSNIIIISLKHLIVNVFQSLCLVLVCDFFGTSLRLFEDCFNTVLTGSPG